MSNRNSSLSTLFLLVLAVSITTGAGAPGDSCHECCIDADYCGSTPECLLGCPLENPNCTQISDCEEEEWGCSGGTICGGTYAELLLASGTLNGYAVSGAFADPANDTFNDTLATGKRLSRRNCDASVLDRQYSEDVERDIKLATATIAL